MAYRSLLLSAGGGIETGDNQSEKVKKTALMSEVFHEFSGMWSVVPSDQDIELLAARSLGRGIEISQVYDSLFKEVAGTEDLFNFEYFSGDYTSLIQIGDDQFRRHYMDQLTNKCGILEKNAGIMLDDNNESIMSRTRAYLAEVIHDVNRGPFYAYHMIEASWNYNLLNFIEGLIVRNDEYLSYSQSIFIDTRMMYDEAREKFLGRIKRGLLDNDRKRYTEYENATRNEMHAQLDVEIYSQLMQVLTKLREQILVVLDGYYRKLRRVMEQLFETFRLNYDDLAYGVTEISISTINEIKTELTEEFKKINFNKMMALFMDFVLANESEWIDEDENKIASMVSRFCIETFC